MRVKSWADPASNQQVQLISRPWVCVGQMHNTAHAQLGQLGCAYAQPSEAWPAGIRSPVQVGNPQGRRAAGPVLCQAVPGADPRICINEAHIGSGKSGELCVTPRESPRAGRGCRGPQMTQMNPTEEDVDYGAVHLKSGWDLKGTTPPHGQMSGRKSTDSLCG